MPQLRKHSRSLIIGTCCAAAGAAGGAIATAGAAPSGHSHPAAPSAQAKAARKAKLGPLLRFARRAVHGDAVVHTKNGFVTVSFGRGTVAGVTGQQLTINEGTRTASYMTVTLTIPATARVRDDGQRATLSQVKPGQRVLVVTAPKRTFVIARTP